MAHAETITRIAEIDARIEWLYDNYSGCDWCCGGGDEALEDLTKERADLAASVQWAIYGPCGGMPNEGREQQPYNTEVEAQAALERGREVWADSASIARIQWNKAQVFPYTGDRRETS